MGTLFPFVDSYITGFRYQCQEKGWDFFGPTLIFLYLYHMSKVIGFFHANYFCCDIIIQFRIL